MTGPPPQAIDYIEVTRQTYGELGYEPYRWVHSDDPPVLARPATSLAGSRVGLLASGGIYAVGQEAFHHRDDTSIRLIDRAADTNDLRATHFAYDLTDARRDINVVFPIDVLRDLADDGVIGELAPRLVTFMGGIYSTRRVREELLPAIVDEVRRQEIDVVLLVPV